MGAAVRKSAPVDVGAGNSTRFLPQNCEDVVLSAPLSSQALPMSFEVSTDPAHNQQQQRHRWSAPTKSAPPPDSGAFNDMCSARIHLLAPHSPGSCGRVSDESTASQQPGRTYLRRPTHLSNTTATTTVATTATATMNSASTSTPVFNSLRDVASSTMHSAATTSTKAPGALTASQTGVANSHSSLNSSCSAFSLCSAESSLREPPLLPAQPQTLETVVISIHGTPTPPAAPVASVTVPPPSLAPVDAAKLKMDPVLVSGDLGGTGNSGEGMLQPSPSSPLSSPLVPLTRVDPATFTAASRTPKGPPRPFSASTSIKPSFSTSAAAAASIPASALTSVAPSCSSFLLDMSFDSRTLTSNAAATSAEIRRIGHRLQKFQRGPDLSSSGDVNRLAAPSLHRASPLSDPVSTWSSNLSPAELQPPHAVFPKLPSLTPPLTSSIEGPAAASAEGPSNGSVEAPFYTETVKFVQAIQQLQRARDAKRTSYTWFRSEAIQAANAAAASAAAINNSDNNNSNTNNVSSAGMCNINAETEMLVTTNGRVSGGSGNGGLPTSGSSGGNVRSSSFNTGHDGLDETDGEAELRSSIRRRDRLPTLVHWMPYETYECDPMTPLSTPTAVCLCSFPVTTFATITTSLSASSPQDGAGQTTCAQTPPLFPLKEFPSTTGTETPPLPSVVATVSTTTSTSCHPSGEGEKLSPTSARASGSGASGLHLTSSSTVTNNSTPSASGDSVLCCPLHVAFRPPSICVTHHWERSCSAAEPSSPVKRQQLVSGQADVPANAVDAPRTSATPLPSLLSDARVRARWRESLSSNNASSNSANVADAAPVTDGNNSKEGSGAKRAIIDAGVPHRRQLAKKALEENSLFFKSLLRRQKGEASRSQVESPRKQQ